MSVQSPRLDSPQWCMVVKRQFTSSAVEPRSDVLPGSTPIRFRMTLVVPSGEVSSTTRSPMLAWVMLKTTSTWSISIASVTVTELVYAPPVLSGMTPEAVLVSVVETSLSEVLVFCHVSASHTAARASTMPKP